MALGALLGNGFPPFCNFCQLVCRHLPSVLLCCAILSKLPLHQAPALVGGMQQPRGHGGDPVTDCWGRLGVCAGLVPLGKKLGRVSTSNNLSCGFLSCVNLLPSVV